MKQSQDISYRKERAFLTAISDDRVSAVEAESLLDELAGLAKSQEIEIAGTILVSLRDKTPAFLLGRGKTDEIIEAAKAAEADSIIIDTDLSPVQQRNWERKSGLTVYDRSELIIKIFAGRALSREARLQVELAELQYMLPRLSHSYEELGRQRGGRYGTKGAGEQKIELDRRRILDRIRELKDEILELKKSRNTQQRRRERHGIPVAAIVGYTNAGKSSLLNALTRAEVLAEDRLFATLDPVTRKMEGRDGPLLLTDTVGFIRNLPHGLIEAFKSTLEVAVNADILIHVLDASDPENKKFFEASRKVLAEIGASEKPEILVFNKMDRVDGEMHSFRPDNSHVYSVSAKTGLGLEELAEGIADMLVAQQKEVELVIPMNRYDIVSMLYSQGRVLAEEARDNDCLVRCRLDSQLMGQLKEYIRG